MSLLDQAFKLYGRWCDQSAVLYRQPSNWITEEEFSRTLRFEDIYGVIAEFKLSNDGALSITNTTGHKLMNRQYFDHSDNFRHWKNLIFDIANLKSRSHFAEDYPGVALPITHEAAPFLHAQLCQLFQDGTLGVSPYVPAFRVSLEEVSPFGFAFSGLDEFVKMAELTSKAKPPRKSKRVVAKTKKAAVNRSSKRPAPKAKKAAKTPAKKISRKR